MRKVAPKSHQIVPQKKARKVSHSGSRKKGVRGESEFVEIMRELGVPTQRVLASGAFVGAKADVKIGITLNEDGSYPDADESQCVMRAEVKHRATNPEHLHTAIAEGDVFAFVAHTRLCPEMLFEYLNQEKITKALVLRRAAIPQGALKRGDYNDVGLVCMGYADFAELLKKAYGSEPTRRWRRRRPSHESTTEVE